jgi:hypothetical protein
MDSIGILIQKQKAEAEKQFKTFQRIHTMNGNSQQNSKRRY